jgi:hypothetical protein
MNEIPALPYIACHNPDRIDELLSTFPTLRRRVASDAAKGRNRATVVGNIGAVVMDGKIIVLEFETRHDAAHWYKEAKK